MCSPKLTENKTQQNACLRATTGVVNGHSYKTSRGTLGWIRTQSEVRTGSLGPKRGCSGILEAFQRYAPYLKSNSSHFNKTKETNCRDANWLVSEECVSDCIFETMTELDWKSSLLRVHWEWKGWKTPQRCDNAVSVLKGSGARGAGLSPLLWFLRFHER